MARPVRVGIIGDYNPEFHTHRATEFLEACAAFLRQGLAERRWTYWLAEQNGQIISHIYIQRVAKVPKPNRLDDALGYMTNLQGAFFARPLVALVSFVV